MAGVDGGDNSVSRATIATGYSETVAGKPFKKHHLSAYEDAGYKVPSIMML